MTTAGPSSAGIQSRADPFAAALRGFGPVGLLAWVIIYFGNALFAPLTALLVLAWAWRSGTPWRAIGFVRPASWIRMLLLATLSGLAFKLAMKALVMPLLGAPAINPAFHYLAGNTAALPGAIYLMIVSAGFGEEVFFRGFLFERFGRLIGDRRWAGAAIVGITSLWFGIEHIAVQGAPGFAQALIVGIVFGAIYFRIRSIWPLIVAHAAFDLTALAIIYWDVETAVARSVWG